MPTKYNSCPLHKACDPTSPKCKKCRFYEEVENPECLLLVAQDRVSSLIGHSNHYAHPDSIAFVIVEMLIDKNIIKEV